MTFYVPLNEWTPHSLQGHNQAERLYPRMEEIWSLHGMQAVGLQEKQLDDG